MNGSESRTCDRESLAVVLQGVDERAAIGPAADRNKYHLNPLEYHGLVNRG